MKSQFQLAQSGNFEKQERWMGHEWKNMTTPNVPAIVKSTGLPEDALLKIGEAISSIPTGFHLHPKLESVMQRRKESFAAKQGFDWAAAEALAYGSLVLEGYNVRLSGQDSQRGTFSHRHSVLHDQANGDKYCQIENVHKFSAPFPGSQLGKFAAINSPLSENGVLGFEYGYSMESPKNYVIWEGQFGDFANNAQCMIDQYICAAESKWQRQSGIVLLLPHGYEGQGPEHSCARLERYLQLCDENPLIFPVTQQQRLVHQQLTNLQVVNITKPANFFHVLRRQVCRSYRKPLIVMSPKSLLRHPLAVSSLSDMTENSQFLPLLVDETKVTKANKIILTSGKVYFDLHEFRTKNSIKDVAILRVEQLCPFPFQEILDEFKKYFVQNGKAQQPKIVWVQEEPMNYGGWIHAYQRLKTVLKQLKQEGYDVKTMEIECVSRLPSGTPATGKRVVHVEEQAKIVKDAFSC